MKFKVTLDFCMGCNVKYSRDHACNTLVSNWRCMKRSMPRLSVITGLNCSYWSSLIPGVHGLLELIGGK